MYASGTYAMHLVYTKLNYTGRQHAVKELSLEY